MITVSEGRRALPDMHTTSLPPHTKREFTDGRCALVHSTALMRERLPEKPPAWLLRGERTFAYPHKEWRKPRVWRLAFFTDGHARYEQRKIIGVGSAFPGRRSGTHERALITSDFTALSLTAATR